LGSRARARSGHAGADRQWALSKRARCRLRRGTVLPVAGGTRHYHHRDRSDAAIDRDGPDARPAGDYRFGRAEQLDFESASFDLVASYVTLVDIGDFKTAIREMARVVRPGGVVLIANLNGFASAGAEQGWVKDEAGRHLHFPVDRYLDEYPFWFAWAGIRIENWHRPLSAYMAAFLEAGLNLTFFAEPAPVSGDAAHQERARRVPWFVVMEWQKPVMS
jgi:SAM-dependent methyltransferase